MPIYDYKCNNCGKVSEIFVHNSGDRNISCPDCSSVNMEKLIAAPYLVKTGGSSSGKTCCGRVERCEAPPCSGGGECRRHQ